MKPEVLLAGDFSKSAIAILWATTHGDRSVRDGGEIGPLDDHSAITGKRRICRQGGPGIYLKDGSRGQWITRVMDGRVVPSLVITTNKDFPSTQSP